MAERIVDQRIAASHGPATRQTTTTTATSIVSDRAMMIGQATRFGIFVNPAYFDPGRIVTYEANSVKRTN